MLNRVIPLLKSYLMVFSLLQEFERQNLAGYRLTKEGDYYFLIKNKTFHHQMRFPHHLGKNVFSHLTNHELGAEDDEENKLTISKEERSYSLPCMFPGSAENGILPRDSRSLLNTGDDATSSDTAASKLRPRSCSDTKSVQKPRFLRPRGSSDAKTAISLPEAKKVLENIGDLRIKEEDKDSK